MPYNTDFLPKAVVRIYKSSSVYLDVTEMMNSQPVVTKLVNRGGQFSFSVSNDGTSANSIIKSSCNLWSDSSTGAVDWGMYVIVENLNGDGTTEFITDGIISTISLTETSVNIQCADMMTVLGSKGADIHRNYYNTISQTQWFSAVPGGGDNEVYVDVANIINNEGTIVDPIYYRVPGEELKSSTEEKMPMRSTTYTPHTQTTNTINARITWTRTLSKMSISMDVNLYYEFSNGKCNFIINCKVYNSSNVLVSQTSYSPGTLSSNQERTMTIPMLYLPADTYTFVFTASGTASRNTGSGGWSAGVGVCLSEENPSESVERYQTTSPTYSYTRNRTVKHYWRNCESKQVNSWSVSGSYLVIDGIADTSIDASNKWAFLDPSVSRCQVPYTSGSIPITDIQSHIVRMIGGTPSIDSANMSSIPELRLFRSGGGYAMDYLQKLADISNSGGQSMSFICRGQNLACYFGARRRSSDSSTYDVVYGDTSGTCIMFSFDPKKTMKSRPSRAMLRGTISGKSTTDKPIMAMVRNFSLEGRRGISTDTVLTDSNSLTVSDAIISAFGTVNTDNEDWEGEMVLSGIVPDLIDSSGPYAGSGKVIRVTDPRYGFVQKKMVITQVKYDYNTLKTTLSLSNVPGIYSGSIADTTLEAYTVGDVAVNHSNSTLYKTQFCYLESSSTVSLMTTGNSASITVPNTGTYTANEVSVYRLPTGRTLIYCAFQMPSSGCTADKYNVTSITITGNDSLTISIPADKRPDAYNDQYLIFNIDVPTS